MPQILPNGIFPCIALNVLTVLDLANGEARLMSPRLRIEYYAIFYYHFCSFIHGGIEKKSLSKRDDFCQNVKCPWSWRAVCGSDGVTYKVSFILKSLTLRMNADEAHRQI